MMAYPEMSMGCYGEQDYFAKCPDQNESVISLDPYHHFVFWRLHIWVIDKGELATDTWPGSYSGGTENGSLENIKA